MINRGSEWHKWDLHVHTPESGMANEFNCTWDEYVQVLFRNAIANDIVALGITDYFTIDGYKKLREEYLENENKLNSLFTPEEIEKIKHILVLPNIEFRLKTLVNNRRVNYHILLSPDLTIQQIEENFLHNIDFLYQDLPFETANVRKLKKCNLEELGKKIKEQQPTFEGSDFEIGCKTAIVDNTKIKELLVDCKDIFGGKYLVAIPIDEDLSKISWSSQEHMVRKALYQESNIFFATNKNTIDFGLGKKHPTIEDYLEEFKSFKPCICGTDAHSIQKIGIFPNDNCCWIKADATFEGLKQIIYEPERVKIQEHNPENKSGYHVIDSIVLDQESIWHGTIGLSPYLNTIIGGRSTGKSTLLQCIAKKISPSIPLLEKTASFIDPLLDGITILWKDGINSGQREIEFFPQSYMFDIANNPEYLKNTIEKIILEKDSTKQLQSYKELCENIKINIGALVNQLVLLQNNINKKIAELKEKGDKKGIEVEIKSIEEAIASIKANASISKEELEQYNSVIEIIAQKDNEIKRLNEDISALQTVKQVSLFNEYYLNKLIMLSTDLRSAIKEKYTEIQSITDQHWQQYIQGTIESLNKKVAECQVFISEQKNTYLFRKGELYFKNNSEYQLLQKKLETERAKLSIFREIEEQITELTKQLRILKKTIIDEHFKYVSSLSDVIAHIHYDGNGVDIASKMVLKRSQMLAFLEDRHNVRSGQNQSYVKDVVDKYFNEHNRESCLEKYIDDCLANNIQYKGGHVNSNVLMELLTTNWYDLYYELTYESDSFENMSQGKKAFVVLKLLLEFSDKQCPILIDQPEDSLDNRAIYNELVKYIRAKRLTRQIILVTHNSNVVVSADAENVIVANQHGDDSPNENGDKFQYINGPLENTKEKDNTCPIILASQGIREHVCEILEGGKDAFEKREQRYGLR